MKFGICNELFENWPWERVCAFAREIGYHGIEIAPFTLAERAEAIDPTRRREIRHAAESQGLAIIGLHWLLAKPPGLYITHPDPAIRNQTSDYLLQLVALCADLGGTVMVIGSPKQRNRLPGVKLAQAFDYAVEVFKPAADAAAKHAVTLAIEPLSGRETDFLMCAADGIELVERINHPNFRLHLDVKAMSYEYKPIPDIIHASAKYLAHFHVNDPNLLGPGMGDVKYEPIIAALREVGYDGWLSVEAFDFKLGPERIARESAHYLRHVTGSSM